MKKFLIALIFFIIPSITHAQDVWIYSHNDTESCYIVEESIVVHEDEVEVTTKEVRDGELLMTIDWKFEKIFDQWRYETSEMDGTHTTVVIEDGLSGKILRFCLDHSN